MIPVVFFDLRIQYIIRVSIKKGVILRETKLIKKARRARKYSYSPYSNYAVGTALLTDGGEVFTGTNIENGVNDLSICAERVALFNAISHGEVTFETIAIVGQDKPCFPCGACRQTLFEHAPDMKVVVEGEGSELIVQELRELLPEPFILRSNQRVNDAEESRSH